MKHPTSGDLLELHFGELAEARSATVGTHARECASCRAFLADVAWVEHGLVAGPEDLSPADGLERVLDRIDAARPVRQRQLHWLRAAGPCAAALLAGTLCAHQGGAVAVLAFFAVGSMLTLALAPVLILESQRRSS
jgi:predicted anti-sigma-YlaC factor YlaD